MERILEGCTDLEFFKNTRLSSECFAYILEKLRDNIQNREDHSDRGGHKPIRIKNPTDRPMVLVKQWCLQKNRQKMRRDRKYSPWSCKVFHPWAKQFTFRVHFLAIWRRNCFRRSGLSSIERYTWNNRLYWWLPCWNSMPRKKYQKDYMNQNHEHYK